MRLVDVWCRRAGRPRWVALSCNFEVLGNIIFAQIAQGRDFESLICTGTPILAPSLLDVDLHGAVRLGYNFFHNHAFTPQK